MEAPQQRKSRLLVQVIARERDVRERLTSVVATNPALCVFSSTLPDVADSANETPPAAIVAFSDLIHDCELVLATAKANPETFVVLVVSDVDWPSPGLDTDVVNRLEHKDERALHEILPTLLDEIVARQARQATPVQEIAAIDRERLALLTEREREVLRLTAEGMSLDEIAKRLHRAFATVAKHRANIMEKTGLHDRVALTRFAIRVGLATP